MRETASLHCVGSWRRAGPLRWVGRTSEVMDGTGEVVGRTSEVMNGTGEVVDGTSEVGWQGRTSEVGRVRWVG